MQFRILFSNSLSKVKMIILNDLSYSKSFMQRLSNDVSFVCEFFWNIDKKTKNNQSWWVLFSLDLQIVNKHYQNEVTLRGPNLSLKCFQPFEVLIYVKRGFTSCHTYNVGSVGQRAAKLPSV